LEYSGLFSNHLSSFLELSLQDRSSSGLSMYEKDSGFKISTPPAVILSLATGGRRISRFFSRPVGDSFRMTALVGRVAKLPDTDNKTMSGSSVKSGTARPTD